MPTKANPEVALRLIGAKREKTVADLRERVRDGAIKVLEGDPDKKYTCYFCNISIDGKVRLLVDETPFMGKESVTRYSCCESCYSRAKQFVYYRGIPFSLS